MKATELMIGDWVWYNAPQCGNVLTQVEAVNSNSIVRLGGETMNVLADDLERVLLTPEILRKNGFELVAVGDNGVSTPKRNVSRWEKWLCRTQFRDFALFYDRVTEYFSMGGIINFKNVHELQHALRVCGIEKEIQL